MLRKVMVSFLAAAGWLAPAMAHADGAKTESVKVGTLAPAESPWGQVFKIWQKAVHERTKLPDGQKTADGKDYALDLVFFWNGQQGDEAAMVAKMKSGQLDGGAITAVGLAQIHRPILTLQLPGLFTTWEKLDHAREVLRGDFEKALAAAGFTLTGWGDVGLAHTMSKGFAIGAPSDIKGKRPYVWRDDPVGPVLFQVLGGVTAVPLGVPEVLPGLNAGSINIVTAPALAAEQLQWASRLDNINTDVGGAGIGALVVTSKKLDSLPADQKAVLLKTGEMASTALTARIRKEDDAAYQRLTKKMTPYSPTEAQKKEWSDVFSQVRARVAQGTFSKELVEKVEALSK